MDEHREHVARSGDGDPRRQRGFRHDTQQRRRGRYVPRRDDGRSRRVAYSSNPFVVQTPDNVPGTGPDVGPPNLHVERRPVNREDDAAVPDVFDGGGVHGPDGDDGSR